MVVERLSLWSRDRRYYCSCYGQAARASRTMENTLQIVMLPLRKPVQLQGLLTARGQQHGFSPRAPSPQPAVSQTARHVRVTPLQHRIDIRAYCHARVLRADSVQECAPVLAKNGRASSNQSCNHHHQITVVQLVESCQSPSRMPSKQYAYLSLSLGFLHCGWIHPRREQTARKVTTGMELAAVVRGFAAVRRMVLDLAPPRVLQLSSLPRNSDQAEVPPDRQR